MRSCLVPVTVSQLNSVTGMIARVSLEIALRKEFDYLIPPGLAGQIEVGSRVQVPFGPRKMLGCRHRAGRGIGAREAQTHSQGHRRRRHS